MSPATVTLILGLLTLVAQEAPIVAPKIKEAFDALKGADVTDITHDELVARVDAAIANLPAWE